MTIKPILSLFFAGILAFSLCACDQEPEPTTEETTEVTVPTLDENKTPEELLRSAAEQTRRLDSFSIDYVRIVGEDRFALSGQLQKEADGSYTAMTLSCGFSAEGVTTNQVNRFYQGSVCYEQRQEQVNRLDSEDPYDLSRILSEMQELSNRNGLIRDFSVLTLNVIPSYDGSFRYQPEELTKEAFIDLLCGTATEPEVLPEGDLTVALTVAPEGHLSAVEFISGNITVTLTIDPLEEDQQITPPDWVKGA